MKLIRAKKRKTTKESGRKKEIPSRGAGDKDVFIQNLERLGGLR